MNKYNLDMAVLRAFQTRLTALKTFFNKKIQGRNKKSCLTVPVQKFINTLFSHQKFVKNYREAQQ